MRLYLFALVCAVALAPFTAQAADRRHAVKTMRVSATAYCQSGTTRSGEPTRVGIVAADPRVLPLGTTVRIDPTRRIYLVADTGSGIKGRELDIYMPSCRQARAFGRRPMQIEVVKLASLR